MRLANKGLETRLHKLKIMDVMEEIEEWKKKCESVNEESKGDIKELQKRI